MNKADRCPSCGTSEADWEQDRDAYTAVYSHCQGCMRRETLQSSDVPLLKGTSVKLLPKAMAKKLGSERPDRPRRRRE